MVCDACLRAAALPAQHAHARGDLRRYAVSRGTYACPQPAGLALHDEIHSATLSPRPAMRALASRQRMSRCEWPASNSASSERCFKRASERAERRRLLPGESSASAYAGNASFCAGASLGPPRVKRIIHRRSSTCRAQDRSGRLDALAGIGSYSAAAAAACARRRSTGGQQ